MLTIKTALTNGEHKVSALSFDILYHDSVEMKPEINLIMIDEAGEEITLKGSAMNAFNIHEVLGMMNQIVEDLNDNFKDKFDDFMDGCFPMLQFISISNLAYTLKEIECMLKEFGAVIKINLTGGKLEPLEIVSVEAA